MKRLSALLALIALAGCTLEPKYVRPAGAVPAAFPAGAAYAPSAEAPPPSLSYRDIFRDPALQALIAQALQRNQDLAIALGNVAAARAQWQTARAGIFPEIGGTGRVNTTHSGAGTINTGVGGNAGGQTGGTGGTGGTGTGDGSGTGGTGGTGGGGGAVVASRNGGTNTTYQANLGITGFEIDLFGRLRSLNKAAFQNYLATEAGGRAARLTIVANVANAYLTLAADRSALAIANETAGLANRAVELTQARLTGGVAPRTDLRQAQTVLETARADLALLTTAVAQDRNALELLAGGPVADTLLPASIEAVDPLIAELPTGLDSRILLRRPDVVQAEHALMAQNARIGAARAAFFPTISLTAAFGFASTSLSNLFTSANEAWSVTPSATLPIFDFGRRAGNLKLAKANREIALAQYQRAVQIAFRDVANALARRGTAEAELASRTRLVEAAQDTATLNDARYRQGIDPYLNSLDAQRTLYASRRTLATIRLTRALNLVALYSAVGGDQVDPAPASAAGAN